MVVVVRSVSYGVVFDAFLFRDRTGWRNSYLVGRCVRGWDVYLTSDVFNGSFPVVMIASSKRSKDIL